VHELSVAEALVRACREGLALLGGARIESVRIAVGELSAVEPDLLSFAWEAVTAGTDDEGARLEIDYVPVRQVCASCGPVDDRQPGTWLRTCPFCDAPMRLSGGDELDVLDISFAPSPPPPDRAVPHETLP